MRGVVLGGFGEAETIQDGAVSVELAAAAVELDLVESGEAGAYMLVREPGTVTAPAAITGENAAVTVGTNALTLTKTIEVTPNVTQPGYVTEGTPGNAEVSLTAEVTTKSACVYHPSTSNTVIDAGVYLAGDQTMRGVLITGLTPENIIQGATVKIGDSEDDDRIMSVSGAVQLPTVVQEGTVLHLS